jgi:hypothetical protein
MKGAGAPLGGATPFNKILPPFTFHESQDDGLYYFKIIVLNITIVPLL